MWFGTQYCYNKDNLYKQIKLLSVMAAWGMLISFISEKSLLK